MILFKRRSVFIRKKKDGQLRVKKTIKNAELIYLEWHGTAFRLNNELLSDKSKTWDVI